MSLKLLTGILLASLFLVACSGSTPQESTKPDPTVTTSTPTAPFGPTDPPTSPVSSTTTPTVIPVPSPAQISPSRATTSTGQATRGGRLVLLSSDPPTLDPHLATDSLSGSLANEVFGGLVTLTPDLEIVGDLAESWELNEDGTVYTFRLHRDARFHNGKRVTAEDVRWSLERVTDPATKSPVADDYLSDIVGVRAKLKGEASSVTGVRVVDVHTLAITVDAPKSYFLAKLTYPTAFVLDRENARGGSKDWTRKPNGTGPFKLAEYQVGKVMRLARNDNYHLEPPYLDEVEFILGGGAAMTMYLNDEIDLTGVGLDDFARIKDSTSSLFDEVHRVPSSFTVSYVGLNVDQPPLDDPKVRQALNYATDKRTIAKVVLEDTYVPAQGILPPGFPGFNPELRAYKYDLDRARQLLRESKYGVDLEEIPPIVLTLSGGFNSDVPLDVDEMLRTWESELGIRVEVQRTEWSTFLNDLHARRFQMFSLAWSADYPDPENFLDLLFHSESENNQTNYHNPKVDALLEQARVERNQETRFRLYQQIEQMIVDDAPWIPLWNTGEQYLLVKPEVNNYYLTPMSIPKYRYVYLSRK